MRLYVVVLFILQLRHCLCSILNQQPSKDETPQSLMPLWKTNIRMNLYVFINTKAQFNDYKSIPDWKVTIVNQQEFNLLKDYIQLLIPKNPEAHQYFAHIFLVKDTFSINPNEKSFSTESIVYVCHSLTKFYENNKGQLQPHWHNTVTISLLNESKNIVKKDRIHPITLKYFLRNLERKTETHSNVGFYRPIIFPNDFWLTKKDAYLLNNTVGALPLTIRLESINLWKFNIYAVLADDSQQQQHSPPPPPPRYFLFLQRPSFFESTKNSMLASDQAYHMLTLANCLFNALFEFLAFKNDITFWRQKTNGTGVSFYSLINLLVTKMVLLLFTARNPLSCLTHGLHISIVVWKIGRMLSFKKKNNNKKALEKKTQQLDNAGARYVLMATVPLFIMYTTTFSSMHWGTDFTHFILLFGPLMAIAPQFYVFSQLNMINHTSFRTIMYKSLNVILDAIFAMMIQMPPLYHLLNAKNNFIYIVYFVYWCAFRHSLYIQTCPDK